MRLLNRDRGIGVGGGRGYLLSHLDTGRGRCGERRRFDAGRRRHRHTHARGRRQRSDPATVRSD